MAGKDDPKEIKRQRELMAKVIKQRKEDNDPDDDRD